MKNSIKYSVLFTTLIATAALADEATKPDLKPQQQPTVNPTENLKLLGTFGNFKLYKNNRACFVVIPGVGKDDKSKGVALFNPKHDKLLLIFANSATAKDALTELFHAKARQSFKSNNILTFNQQQVHLQGAANKDERYPIFAARFTKGITDELEKVKSFSIQFNDDNPKVGKGNVTFDTSDIKKALDAYKKQCH